MYGLFIGCVHWLYFVCLLVVCIGYILFVYWLQMQAQPLYTGLNVQQFELLLMNRSPTDILAEFGSMLQHTDRGINNLSLT